MLTGHWSCITGPWQPKSFWPRFGNCSRSIKSSSGQPPRANHTTVSRCRHFDGEVIIYSTNGHLVLITRLLSLRKNQAGNSQSIYTVRYVDDAKL